MTLAQLKEFCDKALLDGEPPDAQVYVYDEYRYVPAVSTEIKDLVKAANEDNICCEGVEDLICSSEDVPSHLADQRAVLLL